MRYQVLEQDLPALQVEEYASNFIPSPANYVKEDTGSESNPNGYYNELPNTFNNVCVEGQAVGVCFLLPESVARGSVHHHVDGLY